MAYNTKLADKVREYLADVPKLKLEEKKMFRGLTFMVNGKMCISVSNDNLMCRFDPTLQNEIAEKIGFQRMLMKGKEFKVYCYVSQVGYKTKKSFEYWVKLCLDFIVKSTKKR